MLSNDKTIDGIADLYQDVKQYVLLQKEYITLNLAEKLTILFSTLILGFILMCFALLVLFYLSFTLISLMADFVGGTTPAFAIMTIVLLGIAIFLYVKRESLIIGPVTRFIAGVLLSEEAPEEVEEPKDDTAKAE